MPTEANLAAAAGLAPQPHARPTLLTPDFRRDIIEKVAAGRTVLSVCDDLGIDEVTFYRWQRETPAFRQEVAQARVESAHALADKAHEVAMSAFAAPGERGEYAKGAQVCNGTLQWLAGKRQPAIYGERMAIEYTGTLVQIGAVAGISEARRRAVKAVAEEGACGGVVDISATALPALGAGTPGDAGGKPQDSGAAEVMREPEL